MDNGFCRLYDLFIKANDKTLYPIPFPVIRTILNQTKIIRFAYIKQRYTQLRPSWLQTRSLMRCSQLHIFRAVEAFDVITLIPGNVSKSGRLFQLFLQKGFSRQSCREEIGNVVKIHHISLFHSIDAIDIHHITFGLIGVCNHI